MLGCGAKEATFLCACEDCTRKIVVQQGFNRISPGVFGASKPGEVSEHWHIFLV